MAMQPKESPVNFGYWENHSFEDQCGWSAGRDDLEGVQIRDRSLLARLKSVKASNGLADNVIVRRVRRGEAFYADRYDLGTVVRLEREEQSRTGFISASQYKPDKTTFFGIVAESRMSVSAGSRVLMIARESLVANNDRHIWFTVLPGILNIGVVNHTRYSGDGLAYPKVDRLSRVKWLDILRI